MVAHKLANKENNKPPIPFPKIPEPQKVEERGCGKFEEVIYTVLLILALSIAVVGIVIGIGSGIQ